MCNDNDGNSIMYAFEAVTTPEPSGGPGTSDDDSAMALFDPRVVILSLMASVGAVVRLQ